MASRYSSWCVSQMAPHVMDLMSLAAVPHAVTEDDVYAGFFIPKGGSCFLNKSAQCWPTYIFSGAMVLGNTWWVTFVTLSYNASMYFQGDFTRPFPLS